MRQAVVWIGTIVWQKPMATLVTCVLWVIGLLAVGAILLSLVRVTRYLYRPDKTVVSEFIESGKANAEYAAKFHDRWAAIRSANRELGEAGPNLPFSTGGEFVLAEI